MDREHVKGVADKGLPPPRTAFLNHNISPSVR